MKINKKLAPVISLKASKQLSAELLEKTLRKQVNPAKAELFKIFFKTGPGQYGEGDRFLGLSVGQVRSAAAKFSLNLKELSKVLRSPFHEVRLAGVLLLVESYGKADNVGRKKIFNFYMTRSKYINNWDLVDSSAHQIAGRHLENKNRSALYRFAQSKNLWQRRIAIVSTLHQIRAGCFSDTLKISEILLKDKHDLIHKACGWMLREADKRKAGAIDGFLKKHQARMPRTMLRYAIERFSEPKRKKILAGDF